MEDLIYNDADKPAIIKYCKNHIETNGYCNVLYAAEKGVSGKQFKDEGHKLAFLNSISSLIIKDGKYRIKGTYKGGNVMIEKDPTYKEKKYFERYPFREKLAIALITAVLAFGVNLVITTFNKRSQLQTDKDQDQKIQFLQDSITSLKTRLDSLTK